MLKARHYPHLLLRPSAAVAPAVQQSIDISCSPGPQQQTRRTLSFRLAWCREHSLVMATELLKKATVSKRDHMQINISEKLKYTSELTYEFAFQLIRMQTSFVV